MALITRNEEIADGIFLMQTMLGDEETGHPDPGQFYMLRGWDQYPLLSRPVSVFDYEEFYDYLPNGEKDLSKSPRRYLSFLYQVIGEGTMLLSELSEDSELTLEGPFGNGFPEVDNHLTIVGGGIGVAPLYYLAKQYRKDHRERKLNVYLGFSSEAYVVNLFEELADTIAVDVGGIITHKMKPEDLNEKDTVICCGPQIMMDAVMKLVPADSTVYCSLEARMACGVGACLGCSKQTVLNYQKTENGLEPLPKVQVKVCTDGPVFKREVSE